MTSAAFTRSISTHRPPSFLASLGKAIRTAFTAPKAEKPSQHTLDAARVRRMADRHRRVSPGFASDLYAAADRHELDHSS